MTPSSGVRFFPNLQDQQPMSHHELEFMTPAPKNDELWATVSGKGSISPTSVDPNGYSTYVKLLVGEQHWYIDPSCCIVQLGHASPIMSPLSEEHFMENVYKSIIDEHKRRQEAIRNNTPFPAVKRLQRPRHYPGHPGRFPTISPLTGFMDANLDWKLVVLKPGDEL